MSFSETTTSLKVRFLALMDEVGSVAEVARRLDVDRNTAYGWARQAGLSSHRLGHPCRGRISATARAGDDAAREAVERVEVDERTARGARARPKPALLA